MEKGLEKVKKLKLQNQILLFAFTSVSFAKFISEYYITTCTLISPTSQHNFFMKYTSVITFAKTIYCTTGEHRQMCEQ